MKKQDLILIEQYLANPDNPELKQTFERWLNQNPENQIKYDKYLDNLQKITIRDPEVIPDSSIVWQRLEKKISGSKKPENVIQFDSIQHKRISTGQRVWAVAATLVLALFGYLIIQQYGTGDVHYRTFMAETKKVQLSDETVIYLNSESEITVDSDFNESQRKVYLAGQAYFEVTKNSKPFIIETENGNITVLGTAFDVNTRYDRTEVIVKEGKVKLNADLKNELILQANERSIIRADQTIKEKEQIDAAYMIGWLDDRFVFYKTPLNEAVDEIQRRYGVEIDIADPNLNTLTMSGSYAYRSIDSTLQSFCLALDLQLKKEADKYIISWN